MKDSHVGHRHVCTVKTKQRNVADSPGRVVDTLRFIRNAESYTGQGFLGKVAEMRQILGGVRACLSPAAGIPPARV